MVSFVFFFRNASKSHIIKLQQEDLEEMEKKVKGEGKNSRQKQEGEKRIEKGVSRR